jgi:purine nucleosidase
MQAAGASKPPPGVVFDTAMSGLSDALALTILYGLEARNEARVLSVNVSRPSLKAAMFCDVLARFFGNFRGFPIGLAAGTAIEEQGALAEVVDRKDASGAPVYPRAVQKFADTGLTPATARNVLTAQFDGNAIMVLTGPATYVVKMLELPGVEKLVSAKVRSLHVVEEGLRGDAAAAKKLLAAWPTPIVMAGAEVGAAIPFPASSFEKDFTWAPNHPLVDAFRASRGGVLSTAGAAAAVHAVRPEAGFFTLSEASGRQRSLRVEASRQEELARVYAELASAQPSRQPRGRRGQ